MSESLSKPVICIESSIVYKSVKHAEEETGVRGSSIGAVCRGDYGHQTAGSLHWCFWDEEWSNFKLECEKLGVEYTECAKCGVLIVKKINTALKKYCGACSKRVPSGIRKKKRITTQKEPTRVKTNDNCNKRPMGKRKNTK